MLKLGITGGIGSGKSLVTSLFSQLGIPVFDSDQQARQLIDTDPEIRQALIKAFGKQIYLPPHHPTDHPGPLDRKKMGALVFQHPKALATLNAITHPPVIQAAKDWMEQQAVSLAIREKKWRERAEKPQNANKTEILENPEMDSTTDPTLWDPGASAIRPIGYVIKEAALLFESGTDTSLDFILGVYADKQTRIQRITLRDGLTGQAAENRIQKQMDEEEKMKRCDGVILNDGRSLLWPQVMGWHRFLARKIAQAADNK